MQTMGSCVTRPLFPVLACDWFVLFSTLSSHWSKGRSRELILVKNSLACEWLKIEQYIRTAVSQGSAPVLRLRSERECLVEKALEGGQRKKEQYCWSTAAPSLLLIPSLLLQQKRSGVKSHEEPCHCLVESALTSFLPSCLTPVPFLDVSSDQQSFLSVNVSF